VPPNALVAFAAAVVVVVVAFTAAVVRQKLVALAFPCLVRLALLVVARAPAALAPTPPAQSAAARGAA
jgi:hypothetical protein